jgi:hypothetical protein
MVKKIDLKTKIKKFSLLLTVGFLPAIAEACPRCVDATPYKSGLQLAVAVLLPVPFALAYGLYRFIRNESKPELPEA